jgi:hypothetical protein
MNFLFLLGGRNYFIRKLAIDCGLRHSRIMGPTFGRSPSSAPAIPLLEIGAGNEWNSGLFLQDSKFYIIALTL